MTDADTPECGFYFSADDTICTERHGPDVHLGPCIFDGCVATWKHYHGGFPGGYTNPDDPTGAPIPFTNPDPSPGAVRDYFGRALPDPAPEAQA